jgi:hypothetical protein
MKPLDEALAALEKEIAATPLDPSPGTKPSPPPDRTQRLFRDAAGRINRIEVSYADGTVVTKHITRNADHQMAAIHEETTGTDTAKRGVSKFDELLTGLRKATVEARAKDKVRDDELITKYIFKHRGHLTKFLDGTGVSWMDIVHWHTGRLSVERTAVVKSVVETTFRRRR